MFVSQLHRHLKIFVKAVTVNLADYISIPGEEETKDITRRWQRRFCFPQAYGAIDGTHIPITAPFDGYRDYVNRKGWPSIVLQAVCDDKCM